MADDYGYFGKGTEGYVHYMQAVEENSGKKGGGGGKRGGNGGCLQTILLAFCLFVLLCAFVACLVF